MNISACSAALLLIAIPIPAAAQETFNPLERIILSSQDSIDTHAITQADGSRDLIALVRRANGYTTAAFFRGTVGMRMAPGIVTSRSYQDYFVIWDQAYNNLIAVEVDGPDPEYGTIPIAVSVKSKYGALTTKLVIPKGKSLSTLPRAEVVREAFGRLSPEFLASVRTLCAVYKAGEVEGIPPAVALLASFTELTGAESVIVSRQGRGREVQEDLHTFLKTSPLPTTRQTGSVDN